MSIYCGLRKTILYVDKSAKHHELPGASSPGPPTRILEPLGTLTVILRNLKNGPATPLSTRDH